MMTTTNDTFGTLLQETWGFVFTVLQSLNNWPLSLAVVERFFKMEHA